MDASLTAEGNWSIPLGAPVYDAAGEELGRVRDGDSYALVVAHGWLLPHAFAVPLALVARDEDGKVILTQTKDQVLPGDGLG